MSQDGATEDIVVLVIVNGTFGTAFRKGVGTVPSDVVVFTPFVDDHIYTINDQEFKGVFALNNIPSSPNRTLEDYSLNGRVFTVDTIQTPLDPHVPPYGRITLPYPNYIIPHRIFDFAYRDGSTAGPHLWAVPCALVLAYKITADPSTIFVSGPNGRIDPIPFAGNPYCFFLRAGGIADMDGPFLAHARNAWRQFRGHCNGLTCEMFTATQCDFDTNVADRFGVSDRDIETYDPPPHHLSAPNCKNQHTFLLNGTTETIIWY
ncbi:MAG TPA: hypothetical protein VII23_16225 [Terriglobales bacterium]